MSAPDVTLRLGEEGDQKYLVEWLLQPGVLEGFPLADPREVEDAARICLSYAKQGAVLVALWDGVPCGLANLYIPIFKKLAHQSLFMIIVDEKFRGKGVGRKLIEGLMQIAKEKFHIELLHLEVYEGNPAVHLYKKLGFVQYGKQRHFLKEPGRYLDKILMQRPL